MSVDTNGQSKGGSDGDSAEGSDEPAPPRQRTSALIRAAGAIPEGCDVETSLDAFIAEANSVPVDMDGWSLESERPPRDAERDERTRQAVLAAADEARAAAQAEAARRLEHVQRKSAAQVAELQARLALAEERMADAERRARFASAGRAVRRIGRSAAASTERIRRGLGLTAWEKLLCAGLAVFVIVVAALLFGTDDRRGRAAEEVPPAIEASPAPQPVVRPILPNEPTVVPLSDEADAKSPKPARASARKPAVRAAGASH